MRFQTTPPTLPADGAEARAFAEAGGTVVDVRAGVIAAGDWSKSKVEGLR